MIASTLHPLPSQLALGSRVHFPEDVSVILRSDDHNCGNLFLSNIEAASNTSLLESKSISMQSWEWEQSCALPRA